MADHGTPSSTHDTGSSANGTGTGTGTAPARSVKRPRPVKSCIECRKRKLKCDRLLPCSQCQKSQRSCRYAPDGEAANLSDGSDIESAERAPKKSCLPIHYDTPSRGRDARSLQPTSSVLEDYGARLERLERMVLSNSKPSPDPSASTGPQPLAASITIRGLTAKGGLRTRFFGQNSTRVLLNVFDDAKAFMFKEGKPRETTEVFAKIQKIHRALQDEQRKAITPIGVYVDSMTPVQKRMSDIMPKKSVCDQLLHVYLTSSESLYRVVHIPSFMDVYNRWWEGKLQSESFLPQLLSMICIGYRFLGMGQGLLPDRDGVHIPTACALVRAWLDGLRGKQLVDFGTLQAEMLLLMAQRIINPKNQEAWTHMGLIVRMAMTMGLHRDPSEFPSKISPYWAEQRRKVWYTILEIDVQMSMQSNMPVGVRQEDYTCRPPRNLNDDEVYPDMQELPPSRPMDQATDSQIQVYAASTLPYRFQVVDLINRIDSLVDYQQVLECGTALERALDDIRSLTSRATPTNPAERNRNWIIKTILDLHCRRALLSLYRPFALGTPEVPQQILTSYLRSSLIFISYLDDLDPASEDYGRIWHSHNLVFKQDIMQAALSVCYYIKHITNAQLQASPVMSWAGSAVKPESIEEACLHASESSPTLPLPRLVQAVERAFDTQIRRIREIGTDLKDLLSFAVVMGVSRGGSAEAQQERIMMCLQTIVEAGLQATHSTHDSIASLSMMPQTPMSMGSAQTPTGFVNPVQPFVMTDELPNVIPDDYAVWDMEFWAPLLQNSQD